MYYKERYNWLLPARDTLRWADLQLEKNDMLLGRLNRNTDKVKTGARILKEYKLSVFRDSER
jgi:hypothetical protein